MATAVDRQLDEIAAAETAVAGGAPAVQKCRGWTKRMYSPVAALGRRRKLGGGVRAASRLLARLPRWKRLSIGRGWASALLDAAAFRVMYVVEAVVLGLALSCFFCCCGCKI